MASSRVVAVTRRLPAPVLDALRSSGCTVRLHDSDDPPTPAQLLDLVGGASAVICTLADRIDAPVLAAAGAGLRGVATMSVGYSHIDTAACTAAGVRVGFTPGVLTDATADLVLALTLSVLRRLPEAAAAARRAPADGGWGSWKPFWMTGRDLAHATVGIVGLGRIGAAVAARLRGFDARVIYTGRSGPRAPELDAPLNARWAPLDELLAAADVVVLLCPLTAATRGLIGAPQLARMKARSALINAARGEVVDQDALVAALRARPELLAGLDVTTPEPLPLDHPLLALPNCTVLPHIGSASESCREAMAMLCVRNAVAAMDGAEMPEEVEETRGVPRGV